ncbi:unnamed protein product (macronuclear) [Paramecium tetraurelia]|uniref:Uncharacterized protein n=1 Tax=Paramecium tetraurelia TaxID=5888 RepID=A0CB16_PARTE|nr:uncharacterized protein GSPATT00036766001 [Paramecium tetraurelia]CAK67983.1 unnamed protein product [Paramecium tetraurelia]|eukprot:XP_001435380.1 hypothetical protein (macronuclear) [Paramecium tetraurelia strain d4-2]
MESESPVMKKYPIENILNDASGLLKKNGNRKVILLLDKHFMSYSHNEMSTLNIQISRRLMRAAQNLLSEYIQGENIQKVDLLLDRCNLYTAVTYINIQRMLKNERGTEHFEELNSAQIEQKIGLNRLRQRIHQTICIPGSLIKVANLSKLKEKTKVRYYLNECLTLVMKQLIIYARLFKSTNEVQNSLKVMHKIEKLLQIKEMKQTKNIGLIKIFVDHYQNFGQLYFQLCEFNNSLKQYQIAYSYLQQLIFLILKKRNTPNVIDDSDLKPVEQYIMKLVMILYLQSFCYEYLSEYSKMKECIHLAQWFCNEVLRLEDEHQLRILIFSRAQDIQKYIDHILAECEIRHMIFTFLADDTNPEIKAIQLQVKDDYQKALNEKFYLKFKMEQLNKQQYFKLNPVPVKPPSPYLLYNVPKGSRTERELTQQQISKNYQSFTTQDGYDQHRLVTSESESKLIKQNSISSFSRRTRPTDFTQYCKTEQSDYPKLDQELAGVIVNQLKKEQAFYSLADIQRTCKDELNENQRQQQDYELGKAILMFKRQFSKSAIAEPKETDSLKQLNNEIKTEFQLVSGYLEAQERLKKKRQQQQLFEQSLKPKPKTKTPFRKILIKHCNTLGLKQTKKKLQTLEEESALMKLYQKISGQKEDQKQQQEQQQNNEDQIIRQMIQTNLNAIKLIMDDNQQEQENAQKQLKSKRHISEQMPSKLEKAPNNQQFRESFKGLANSTQYLSTKGQATKNVVSLLDLSNIKRKMNHLKSKKLVRYSELFKSQL